MAYCRDGAFLVLARKPRVAKLVDPSNGRELATLEPRDPQVLSWFCFGPGATRLAMGSSNRRIYLWDLQQIHRQLTAMNLQWGPPPASPTGGQRTDRPLRVEVVSQ